MRKGTLVVAACVLLTAAAFPQDQSTGKTVGTWKANLVKTTAPTKPKSMVIRVTEDTPNMVKYNFTTVSADGKTTHGAFSGAPDGEQHPITGSSTYKSAAYKRADNGTIQGTLTMQDGSTVSEEITLSDDGKTMTIQNKSGDKSWTDVFDRTSTGAKKAAAKKPA